MKKAMVPLAFYSKSGAQGRLWGRRFKKVSGQGTAGDFASFKLQRPFSSVNCSYILTRSSLRPAMLSSSWPTSCMQQDIVSQQLGRREKVIQPQYSAARLPRAGRTSGSGSEARAGLFESHTHTPSLKKSSALGAELKLASVNPARAGALNDLAAYRKD